MKSRQFCSVCKDWLDMEVVPTSDGDDDDGVIWFRCPQCQGFLPKLSGADANESDAGEQSTESVTADPDPVAPGTDSPLRWDSPADMMAEQKATGEVSKADGLFLPEDGDTTAGVVEAAAATGTKKDKSSDKDEAIEPKEPIAEYAALLAESDTAESTPYRPWGSYEVGQCVHHLAWEDCGVVVAKEELPGGRRIIKCYFEDAGVVRLIEQAPR